MPAPAPDLLEAVGKTDLSDVTKRNYRHRAAALQALAGDKPLYYIVAHPEIFIQKIAERYPKHTSAKAYVTFILGLFRYNKGLREQLPQAYDRWAAAFADADKAVEDRYKSNAPSDRQREGYVEFDEIVKKRDELRPGCTDRLLLGFYSHLPPIRCEYGRIALYNSEDMPDEPEPNFIMDGKVLLISHFKTRKHHEAMAREIPDALAKDLALSLKERPRDYLFVNKSGRPFTPNAFCHWTGDAFKRLFGRPLTVSLLRHSFINTLDFNKLTIKEKEVIAAAMQHTVATQDRYRLIFNK